MKKFFIVLSILFLFSACIKQGETYQGLYGNEDLLPDELKGLKVYTVGTSNGGSVQVAIFDNKVNSLTYMEGKVQETTIILNKGDDQTKVITVKEVLFENDEIMVIKKK